MAGLKLIPLLLSWGVMVLAWTRAYAGYRTVVRASAVSGFIAGIAGGGLFLQTFRDNLPFDVIKMATGGVILLFWGTAVTALYRVTGARRAYPWIVPFLESRPVAAGGAFLAGMVAAVVCVCRILPQGGEAMPPSLLILMVLAGLLVALTATVSERFVPQEVALGGGSFLAIVTALILFMTSSLPRLDLFSPLTMKVMKFIHDFVHQFFETMLVPDHPFFRTDVWGYIGLLFGNGVGLFGGLVIWFAPALVMLLALRLEPLPSVAHIRQGAQRRKLLAAAMRQRNCRLFVPGIAVAVLAAAVYQSRFPAVEYWDPKPLPVSPAASGIISIPVKGEIDLLDGKIHKFHVKTGGREARFMLLNTPAGHLTVTLDACSICKPDGYGQTEGNVICYYCKTLIPLETVGKPGGCNPVPVPFTEEEGWVRINAMKLLNAWGETVQATTRVKGARK